MLLSQLDTVAVKGRREVDYAEYGRHEATIYDSDRLAPGMTFSGPAVIEDPGMTIVVFPKNAVSIDGYGNTCITNLLTGEDHA